MAGGLRRAVALGTAIACCSAASSAIAADLAVPARYPSIARAMRAAKPGDRVVVSGGTWRHVRVTRPRVSLVGEDGAVIAGTTIVSGRGATLSGFTIRGSVVAPRRAKSVTVSGNTVLAGGIRADGDDAVISGNTVACEAGAAMPGYAIASYGDRAQISWNHVEASPEDSRSGILVAGDGGGVTSNSVSVSDERWGTGAEISAIEIRGTYVSVEGNDVSHSMSAVGIVVRGDGATVSDNAVHADSGGSAIVIDAGVTLVSGNTIVGTAASAGSGIVLDGDGNAVRDNTITGVGVDGVRVVSGAYNGLGSNVVTNARCGINVCSEATGTQIVNCTATGACTGLLNGGSVTTVSGCTFLGNRDHDVVVSNPCHVFQNNQFSTSDGTLVEGEPATKPQPTPQVTFIGDFGVGGD